MQPLFSWTRRSVAVRIIAWLARPQGTAINRLRAALSDFKQYVVAAFEQVQSLFVNLRSQIRPIRIQPVPASDNIPIDVSGNAEPAPARLALPTSVDQKQQEALEYLSRLPDKVNSGEITLQQFQATRKIPRPELPEKLDAIYTHFAAASPAAWFRFTASDKTLIAMVCHVLRKATPEFSDQTIR